jgi:hypothetical protein
VESHLVAPVRDIFIQIELIDYPVEGIADLDNLVSVLNRNKAGWSYCSIQKSLSLPAAWQEKIFGVVMREMWPFIAMQIITLLFITYIPETTLWIPSYLDFFN